MNHQRQRASARKFWPLRMLARCMLVLVLGATFATAQARKDPVGAAAQGSQNDPASVGFDVPSLTAVFGTKQVTARLVRSGNTSQPLTVAYDTVDSAAMAGRDYVKASGTIEWPAGDDGVKTVSVSLSPTHFLGYRDFAIRLRPAAGVAVRGSTALIVAMQGELAGERIGEVRASRLLQQMTFGASLDTLSATATQTYEQWFREQAALPPTLEEPKVTDNWRIPVWWHNAVNGRDQLRLRIAFALSEILVISQNHPQLSTQPRALAHYYDQLTTGALGNYRDVLDAITHSPAMGHYLSFFKNRKPTGKMHADENFAREVMQLFTVGLWRLNPDGSQMRDTNGQFISAYTQDQVTDLARVFTGWASSPAPGHDWNTGWTYDNELLKPMACYSVQHDSGAKVIIDGVKIPSGGSCESDTKRALDVLFNHPNVGPFIAKQLIQRTVTSNPSPGYVARVAAVFADNGHGVRGDLLAVATAIATDSEATVTGDPRTYGKLREPLLKLTALWRAFSASAGNGKTTDQLAGNATANFGQQSLLAPTVFNFFRPDYQRAGPLSNAGLVVPEFQIVDTNTVVMSSNDLQWAAYRFVDASGHAQIGVDNVGGQGGPTTEDMLLHTQAWEAAAKDPAALVDKMNLVFMAGAMPAAMRRTLIDYATAVPADHLARRVVEVAALLIASPQYAVQR